MFTTSRVGAFHLMLIVGLFQIALYWFSGSMACCDGVIATPQYDTPLYYQAARRIAEGHPFSFSEGTAVSTGTTSVVYPFVLAVLYCLGFKGGGLIVAGFALNAVFYLCFVSGWASIACRAFAKRQTVRVVSVLLFAAALLMSRY